MYGPASPHQGASSAEKCLREIKKLQSYERASHVRVRFKYGLASSTGSLQVRARKEAASDDFMSELIIAYRQVIKYGLASTYLGTRTEDKQQTSNRIHSKILNMN